MNRTVPSPAAIHGALDDLRAGGHFGETAAKHGINPATLKNLAKAYRLLPTDSALYGAWLARDDKAESIASFCARVGVSKSHLYNVIRRVSRGKRAAA